jgi:aminopeptidase N
MSVYLVAYAICDFKMISAFTKTSVRVDVIAKSQSIDDGDGDFALDETTKVLEFFEDFFKSPYPMQVSCKLHNFIEYFLFSNYLKYCFHH